VEGTDEFWAEWRRLGRLIGVGYGDLPETWSGLLAYFDEMVEHTLENTEAAQDVLASLRDPAAPPLPGMRGGLWRIVSWPPTRVGLVATLGMLAPGASRAARSEMGRWQGEAIQAAGADRPRLAAVDAAGGQEVRASVPALARRGGRRPVVEMDHSSGEA